MANPEGFLKVQRVDNDYRPVNVRLHDFEEVEQRLPDAERKLQASRCMDCGVPFCHWACPVANVMPEWQDKLYQGDWKAAYEILQETNNFPEFTGRVCPALCEPACVVSINGEPVTIRNNELAIIEYAFEHGYVQPCPPKERTGKKVAVIGSGPAGLACADTLNQKGHTVVLYEASDNIGGYLRFGIPDFKLNKRMIDRRVNILLEEGLIIQTGVTVGRDLSIAELKNEYDAVCIAIGARKPRDLSAPGRNLDGIHLALDFLTQQNRVVRGDVIPEDERITAFNKQVVVIGGGDTGADCVGTANRQGAKSVTQLEILPQPPEYRTEDNPWPQWPRTLRTSSSHEEGCTRLFNITTKAFLGQNEHVREISVARVNWTLNGSGKQQPVEEAGSEFNLPTDLVLLAMGFVHVVQEGLVAELGIALNPQGNIAVDGNFMTSVDGVFAAGDSKRGASLVVWAIHEGRAAAEGINTYLATG